MPRFLAHSTVPFLSTPSARRATRKSMHRVRRWIFLSTPSARRATEPTAADLHRVYISIHALREEGDALPFGSHLRILFISIHALREEGDTDDSDNTKNKAISIHALREEGDVSVTPYNGSMFTFLSTPSARRATTSEDFHCIREPISIHALREEGDTLYHKSSLTMRDFYPRPPRGGRRVHAGVGCVIVGFLSTPSARRATFEIIYGILLIVQFLSTPSARRATGIRLGYKATVKFLSTPSARRATFHRCRGSLPGPAISIHALREEGDYG